MIFPLTCKGKIQIPLMGIGVVREKISYVLEQEGCKEVVVTDHNKISFKGTP